MSDGSLLLIVLWVIYLPECLLWIGRHSVLFTAQWARSWTATTAGEVLGTASGSVRHVNPLPPLGRFHRVDLLPVSISPTHVAAFNPQSISQSGRPRQSGVSISLDAIRGVTVRENEVRINGHVFAKIVNADLRASLVKLLNDLRALPAEQRARLIEEFWQAQFDLEKARAALAETRRQSSLLAAACNGQFVLIYIVLPALSLLKGLNYVLIPGAIAMEFMAIQIAVLHFRAHRRLHPKAKSDRVIHLAKVILCPPLGIRAVDTLTGPAVGRFHILTVAEALPAFPGRLAFMSRVLRDLRHPISHGAKNGLLAGICRWQGDLIERVAARSLPGAAAIVPTLDAPPPRIEKDCRCYCPRCGAQLSIATETCPDCPGVAMIPVAASESQPEAATIS
ncbi:MAG TPA: hypothetical protein VMM36_00630 [Opitutaceae bacterium]|nr:hypothetical protein [Opitutaceae bacterium]